MKNQARVSCVCGYKLVAGNPAFLDHLWSKQNCQALFVYHADLNRIYVIFCPILPVSLQFLTE